MSSHERRAGSSGGGPGPLVGVRVLVAPDKFKGTLTAADAAEVISSVARELGAETRLMPVADGGDGTLAVLGGPNRRSRVTGPHGRPVDASWRLSDGVAVIEAAEACGLVLAGGAERNDPVRATSAGVGELIGHALDEGARRVLVGVGGVATTDGGAGALRALGDRLPLARETVEVLTDVETPFRDAAVVFGPQKGADAAQVAELTERLRGVRLEYLERFGVDVWDSPRTGAAGGLSGALFAAGATLVDGARVVLRELRFADHLAWADLVVTGEGRFDTTTLAGKAPGVVVAEAVAGGRGIVVVAGDADVAPPGVCVRTMIGTAGSERAFAEPADALRETVQVALVAVRAQPGEPARPAP
ncbi:MULTISPECIES: glycerate kinase [unclassified Nocardioides]|uniref:glycerate kinase n=1 Tax=unclassified Nocardioides TaxID=2615069 RepID=UPI0009F0372B|nr:MULTISPECIES: glycerate kinase [unclassified Nocardioides]GAW51836.1 Glycerate kinase [Nocardioides sp. PD653-B2]GAW53510.1 Glycerate kinase [Nocardioides sp. PD653]